MTARSWPVALGASLFLHLAVGVALLLALGHRDADQPPQSPPPRPFDVLRIGALLPRAGRPATPLAAPPRAPRPPAQVKTTTPAAAPPVTDLGPAHAEEQTDSLVAALTAAQTDSAAATMGRGDGDAEPGAATGALEGTASSTGVAGAPERSAPVAGPSASLVAEVHGRLAAAARDCYPAQAKRFRQRGLVPLSFCVSADGAAEQVSVRRSGLALLDDAARGCVLARAAPFPVASRGHCFVVDVEFGSGANPRD